MSMSNERLNEIHEHVRDAFRGLEVKGNTSWEGIVVLTDATELLAEVARLQKALTITDEMVEHAAKAMYWQEFGSGWDDDPTEGEKDEFLDEARRILEAALGKEK